MSAKLKAYRNLKDLAREEFILAGAPAGAQGVRDALDILRAKGKLRPEDDLQVVVAGDGSTDDMALSATSGTLYRQLDYWYLCYDNEAYGNTGMQPSSATPYAAWTATTPGGAGGRWKTTCGARAAFATCSSRRSGTTSSAPCSRRWIAAGRA